MALSREAGVIALGMNSLVMQIYGIVVSVCISGLNVSLAALSARTKNDEMGRLLFAALPVLLALWSAIAAPLFLFRKALADHVLGNRGLYPTLSLMLVCILMTGIENVLKSIHIGSKLVSRSAVSEVLEQGVRFFLVIMLLKNTERSLESETVFLIILGMTISEIVSVTFLFVSYVKYFGFPKLLSLNSGVLSDVVKIAFPATLTSVSSNVFSSAGALMLPSLLTGYGMTAEEALSEIGVMNTAAVPISMLPMAFVGAIAAVIMPEISEKHSKKEDPSRIIGISFLIVMLVGSVSIAALFVFADDIAEKLFGLCIDSSVMRLLNIKAYVIFFQITSVSILNGLMKQKTVLTFAFIGEVYQLIMIMLLTPVFGLRGYAAGMIIGELLRFVLNIIAVKDEINKWQLQRQYDRIKPIQALRGGYGKKRKKDGRPFGIRFRAEVFDNQGKNCSRGRA